MLNVFLSREKKERHRIWRSLDKYSVYAPPHTKNFNENEAKENFSYFMNIREERINILSIFLAEVAFTPSLSESAIDELGNWLFCNGRHLLPLYSNNTLYSITRYEPSWEGDYRGMNVINDIGIFVGEYIISKNSSVHWDLFIGNTHADCYSVAYLLPSLFGITEPFYASRKAIYMTDEILWACYGSKDYLRDKPSADIDNLPLWYKSTDLRRVVNGMANIKPMKTYLG